MLGEALSGLDAFRLLLGRPLEVINPDENSGVIDLPSFYRQCLREGLEQLPLNRDYARLID